MTLANEPVRQRGKGARRRYGADVGEPFVSTTPDCGVFPKATVFTSPNPGNPARPDYIAATGCSTTSHPHGTHLGRGAGAGRRGARVRREAGAGPNLPALDALSGRPSCGAESKRRRGDRRRAGAVRRGQLCARCKPREQGGQEEQPCWNRIRYPRRLPLAAAETAGILAR